ncbi:protein lifeguard 1-like [Haliotis cracherodii]|uniref:protein lifeguard 1-like n=1 Tax=Haliotis cracherodii TaxID=6455 RepID=UPI0039E8D06C
MYDPEADPVVDDNGFQEYNSFSEKSIRLGFIRKVYGILTCQIAVTIAIMSLFLYVHEVREYSRNNPWMWFLALAITFIAIIVLACCPNVRRQSPTNMILLAVFTICEGFLLGTVASHYDQDAVLMAVGVTAIVTVSLTIFAFQTKWDFTMMGGMLFVFLIVLLCFGLLCAIIRSKYVTLVYACLGALLFCAYLVFDTQLMLGGKHKYSLSPEEYIFASLNLYLDIVNMFLYILTIIGIARD